ncbi:MAG: peptidoglycan-binding protein [Eubacteriales bacterium]|nr:peptidoglycan-binding protein [Eubacteriales bacterium]
MGYALPKYGADSEFGAETEKALLAFQKKAGLEADGKYGDKTHAALMDAVADDDGQPDAPEQPAPEELAPVGTTVVIVSEGGKVNVRMGNGTQYSRISAVAPGTTFDYVASAANGWHAVVIGAKVGWVSGNYSKVIG